LQNVEQRLAKTKCERMMKGETKGSERECVPTIDAIG